MCVIILLCADGSYAQVMQPVFIPASDTNIQYIGRFDFTDRNKPVFMYSGCAICTRFTGSGLQLHLQDDSLRNWFTIKLDDSLFTLQANKADGIYSIGEHLSNTVHTVKISRRTEWHGGNTTFQGFTIDTGRTLPPVGARK